MNRIEIDPTNRVARVGAGVLSGALTWEAGRHGLAPVLGEAASVGVSGVTLGGGLGWLSGQFGAACDNLHSVRVATADGRLLTSDARSNPDLFWALRGGTGNFGVATTLEFKLHPIGPVTEGKFSYPLRDVRTILNFHREFMANAPDWFHAELRLRNGDPGAFVDFYSTGTAAESERLVRLLHTVAEPSEASVKRLNYWEFAGEPPAPPQQKPISKGFVSAQGSYLQQLSPEVIDLLRERLASAPSEAVLGISHYMHGQQCRVPVDATAFALRQQGGLSVFLGMVWEDSAETDRLMSWADQTWRLLQPFSAGRIYSNYQTDESRSAPRAVFGNNLPRLMAIKKKYDPSNFFRRNSNINPT